MSPNFKIRYSRSSRIVRIHLMGRIGLDERLLAARQLVVRFRHLAHLRLLVDARYAHSMMTTEEQERLADFVCAHPVLCRARIAVLFSSRFSPSLGALQNMVQRGQDARGFLVEGEALEWLNR
ncbi:hypothetical protein [Microbulbifer hainanensis]|uniref:hypothetical protein n=1 Tax=Microbulbifer hainanensis TaxID=2735675 RepID=UPI0018664980|nr:hypothetical protein [Microbulbifer hainanensis]